jgi:hypothetical protein
MTRQERKARRRLHNKVRIITEKFFENQKKKNEINEEEKRKIAEKIQTELDVCLGVTIALMRL